MHEHAEDGGASFRLCDGVEVPCNPAGDQYAQHSYICKTLFITNHFFPSFILTLSIFIKLAI